MLQVETPHPGPLALFLACYRRLSRNNLDSLAEVYHQNVVFEDPAHRIEGWPALNQYFRVLYQNVDRCEFQMHHWLEGESEAFIQWTMVLAHPRLDSGRPREVEGCTRIAFQDGRVVHHRDYFDLGQMLYEGLPLLGSAVRHIKGRLGQ